VGLRVSLPPESFAATDAVSPAHAAALAQSNDPTNAARRRFQPALFTLARREVLTLVMVHSLSAEMATVSEGYRRYRERSLKEHRSPRPEAESSREAKQESACSLAKNKPQFVQGAEIHGPVKSSAGYLDPSNA